MYFINYLHKDSLFNCHHVENTTSYRHISATDQPARSKDILNQIENNLLFIIFHCLIRMVLR